jgi:hypothetical protein
VKLIVGSVIGLFLVLAVLRLGDVVAWSWWWVTLPLWLPVLAFIALFLGQEAIFLFRRYGPPFSPRRPW